MKHILVTGGAGYIGRHVVLALREAGENVVVLDDLSTGYKAPEDTAFIEGNIADRSILQSIFNRYDVEAVMHLAAFVSVEESVKNPEKYFKNNTENSKILFEEALAAHAPYIIFSSTAAVYGNPSVEQVDEQAPLQPLSPYGESKVRAEKILEELSRQGLRYVTLRYFNVAGADSKGRAGYRITKTPTHLIRTALQAAARNREDISVYGTDYPTPDGTCVRDYIHVSDIADAHLSALTYLRKGNESEVFNCGYGEGYSVKQVIEVVKKNSGNDFKVEYADRRAGDPAKLIADSSKLMAKMGWQPKHNNLEHIIQTELEWVRQHS
jgi:UDP-glucose 4-epimerase